MIFGFCSFKEVLANTACLIGRFSIPGLLPLTKLKWISQMKKNSGVLRKEALVHLFSRGNVLYKTGRICDSVREVGEE